MIKRITEGARIPFGISWVKLKANFYHGSPKYFVIWLRLPWWGYNSYGKYGEYQQARQWMLQLRVQPEWAFTLLTPWKTFGNEI